MGPSSELDAARAGRLVIMAGAGVSAAPPTRLPSWKPLNRQILHALGERLIGFMRHEAWFSQMEKLADTARESDRFPPEYQSQIIEEMCGERYFRALVALDVDVRNVGHEAIAALAAAGALRAVVTTNFDRLIERALDARGVRYRVAYDEAGFDAAASGGDQDRDSLLVIKIHGCVTNHLSLIDTLKQRKLGRSARLQACLDVLHDHRWMYLGFSARDLEGDSTYLGLIAGARRSPGATYVAYPGNPPKVEERLSQGARALMTAYGARGRVVVADVAEVLCKLAGELGIALPSPQAAEAPDTAEQVGASLKRWAEDLTPAAAGLCFAAVLEAVGEAEIGVRLLDRLIRHELMSQEERSMDGYREVQLHYGRLGSSFGCFTGVLDLNGAQSNVSVESLQSLLRLNDTDLEFASRIWLIPSRLWMGDGAGANREAEGILRGLATGSWGGSEPACDEEAADGWIAAAQACVVNDSKETMSGAVGMADVAQQRARRCGDVIRVARVEALRALLLGGTKVDLPGQLGATTAFAEAERLHDGFALGFRALALGRWLVGPGGLALGASDPGRARATAEAARLHLNQAIELLRGQGIEGWIPYACIQLMKASADLRDFEAGNRLIEVVVKALSRFPIWSSHLWEATAQMHLMLAEHEQAAANWTNAIREAANMGLNLRASRLTERAPLYASRDGS